MLGFSATQNNADSLYPEDNTKIGEVQTINDTSEDINIRSIHLGASDTSITVSQNVTIEELFSDNNSSLVFNITDSAALTLGKAAALIQDNNQSNTPSDYSSLTQIILEPGTTLSAGEDITVSGHLMVGGQSFTNTSHINMGLVFNGNINAFELQPLGNAEDLG